MSETQLLDHRGQDLNDRTVFAMHQPNYIPWLGYFYKMANCDIFVYMDNVRFPQGRNFSTRNTIKTANGTPYLTIPVSVPKIDGERGSYNHVEIADQKWKAKHLKSIEHAYKKAPYFDEVFELYAPNLQNHDTLVDINVSIINAVKNYLGIDTQTMLLSDILTDLPSKTELIVEIAKKINANVYLSGAGGGREYNDPELLEANDIGLSYSIFESPVYDQMWGEFNPNLSILDALFNCGPSAYEYVKG